MTHPQSTFELRIALNLEQGASASQLKDEIKEFLLRQKVDGWVEGTIENVDIDNEFGTEPRDFYGELGGDLQPLSIFKYSREHLEDLAARLLLQFGEQIQLSWHSMATSEWMEGWKQSFLPFATEKFYVFPPWFRDHFLNEGEPKGLLPLVIEPGMAFGTGQHATTQLCLRELERQEKAGYLKGRSVLDVGTGTGILAFAAHKLGAASLMATDIDPDALLAVGENLKLNAIAANAIALQKCSVPEPSNGYDLVIANILTVVLTMLMPSLCAAVRPQGHLVLSGCLVEDRHKLIALAEKNGLQFSHETTESGWACLVLARA